jgi:hypothetical protein
MPSDSNRKEYQEYFLGGKGGRCEWLTTLSPSCVDCLEILEIFGPVLARTGIAFCYYIMHKYTHVYMLYQHILLRTYVNANIYNATGRYLYFYRRQNHPHHHTKKQTRNPFTGYFKYEDIGHCPIYSTERCCWVVQINSYLYIIKFLLRNFMHTLP